MGNRQKLKMSAQEAVASLGVKGYNDECRSIVQRYVAEWRSTITRLGRWVDLMTTIRRWTHGTWSRSSGYLNNYGIRACL